MTERIDDLVSSFNAVMEEVGGNGIERILATTDSVTLAKRISVCEPQHHFNISGIIYWLRRMNSQKRMETEMKIDAEPLARQVGSSPPQHHWGTGNMILELHKINKVKARQVVHLAANGLARQIEASDPQHHDSTANMILDFYRAKTVQVKEIVAILDSKTIAEKISQSEPEYFENTSQLLHSLYKANKGKAREIVSFVDSDVIADSITELEPEHHGPISSLIYTLFRANKMVARRIIELSKPGLAKSIGASPVSCHYDTAKLINTLLVADEERAREIVSMLDARQISGNITASSRIQHQYSARLIVALFKANEGTVEEILKHAKMQPDFKEELLTIKPPERLAILLRDSFR